MAGRFAPICAGQSVAAHQHYSLRRLQSESAGHHCGPIVVVALDMLVGAVLPGMRIQGRKRLRASSAWPASYL